MARTFMPVIPESFPQIKDNSGQLRHELKYVVPAALHTDLRAFAEPFCVPDPAANGYPPEYRVTTLQLDNHSHSLHLAKERERLNRFKLRVRTYNTPGQQPEFLEIKRKLENRVLKTRCMIPPKTFCKDFVLGSKAPGELSLRSKETYWDFLRLVNQLDAQPVALIRYERESWIGKNNPSHRLTMDRRLEYSMTDQWSLIPKRSGTWRRMDTGIAFQLPYPPMILEMKAPNNIPEWMLRIVRFFSLQRVGFCKYSTALRLESLFEGHTYSDTSENTSYL